MLHDIGMGVATGFVGAILFVSVLILIGLLKWMADGSH